MSRFLADDGGFIGVGMRPSRGVILLRAFDCPIVSDFCDVAGVCLAEDPRLEGVASDAFVETSAFESAALFLATSTCLGGVVSDSFTDVSFFRTTLVLGNIAADVVGFDVNERAEFDDGVLSVATGVSFIRVPKLVFGGNL